MKKKIPFEKEIQFTTSINEIIDIEVTHDIKFNDNNEINGLFYVSGEYKILPSSITSEKFSYELPFTAYVDNKYDIENAVIKINDFNFDIINSNILKVNIELEISNVEERCYDKEDNDNYDVIEENIPDILDEFNDNTEKLDIETYNVESDNLDKKNINELFTNLNNTDTYKSYYVYKMRESDTLNDILNKYNITKEDLELYNDLSNIKIGTKLIIPCSNE